jgi:hypothetical protein
MQLYAGFCRWSYLNGERFPATQTMFGTDLAHRPGVVSRGSVKYSLGETDAKQVTVYLVGNQPEGKTRRRGLRLHRTCLRNRCRSIGTFMKAPAMMVNRPQIKTINALRITVHAGLWSVWIV